MKILTVISVVFFAISISSDVNNSYHSKEPICVKRYTEEIQKHYEYYQGTIEYRTCSKGDRTKNYLTNNIYLYDDGDVIWVRTIGKYKTSKIHKDLITKYKVKKI